MPQAASLKETLTIAALLILLIAPIHANPVEVGNESELRQALDDEAPEIRLTNDIELEDGEELNIEHLVIIDGNGFTIDGSKNISSGENKSILNMLDAEEITLNNLTLLGGATQYGGGAITATDALTVHGRKRILPSSMPTIPAPAIVLMVVTLPPLSVSTNLIPA